MTTRKPLRTRLATSVSRSAAALSRATGRGDGSVIGGRIGLMIDPDLLAHLAAGRQIALISGTNGKTTTTRLTAAALGVLGPVATNSFGANLPTGHTSALAKAGDTPYAVLEVDEHYLPQVLRATAPKVVALLNLSRDQLDRAKEVAMMAQLWRDALRGQPVHLVANADDPMVVWAALSATGGLAGSDTAAPADGPVAGPTVPDAAASRLGTEPTSLDPELVALDPLPAPTAAPPPAQTGGAAPAIGPITWVAAGQRWHDDSWVCPACGGAIARAAAADAGPDGAPDGGGLGVPGEPAVSSGGGAPSVDWRCTACALRRPVPHWTLSGGTVVDPSGQAYEIRLQLPGRVNQANAATALAVAARFGVRPADALPRLAQVASIAGRYAQVQRDGRAIRLLLAKNPAGWLEAFDMAEPAPTLLAINARDPDGLDTSWLFDVDFSPLAGRPVMISGDRAYDLAVRLEVNDVPFTYVRSFGQAVAATPPGRLEVIANYTAFQDIRAELDRVN